MSGLIIYIYKYMRREYVVEILYIMIVCLYNI